MHPREVLVRYSTIFLLDFLTICGSLFYLFSMLNQSVRLLCQSKSIELLIGCPNILQVAHEDLDFEQGT